MWCRYMEEAVIEARMHVKLCVLEGGLDWSWWGKTAVAFGLQGGPGGITSGVFQYKLKKGGCTVSPVAKVYSYSATLSKPGSHL